MNSAFWQLDSYFRCGLLMNYAYGHHRFEFSLEISNELCVAAPQIQVFADDFQCILRTGTTELRFR